MPEEVLTIVKIPLSEIEENIRNKHTLPSKLVEARIDGENLILSFSEEPTSQEFEVEQSSVKKIFSQKMRRSRKKRNRMKTRGWIVVARFTNSKGQQCSIYKPFVDALNDRQLNADEQRKKVETILRANRNKPSDESIRYFLDNTLEYLKGHEQNQQ
ncbi:MAG: hypothetical protein NWE93_06680 [Candidatus Bathyarchaeota archaeon]|nr:hypothetical protein [Candidatus Bathyarchaeota archaeon]